MFDPTEDKLDRDFDESMRMFEKAMVPIAEPIEPKQPARVLIAIDGSSQDAAIIEAATTLQKRFDATLLVLDARETDDEEAASPSIDSLLAIANSERLAKSSGTSYDQILAAIESRQPDLVVLPCPFGRDFQSIGAESIGTVVDVILSRSPVPLLIIRSTDQPLATACKQVAMVVSSECDAEPLAAGWALGLSSESASISLEVVMDREQLENLQAILEVLVPERTLEPEQLNTALAESHSRLHVAMQKAAQEAGLSYRLVPKATQTAPPLAGQEAVPQLIVLAYEIDDHFVHGFIMDRIRRSPHPVLVASTHQ
ncbi:MAG: universal stress protein [Pirellulaceae bacterium]